MSSIETLRAILVAGAVVAMVVAMITGFWLAALVMAFGVAVHGVATPFVRRRSAVTNPATVAPPELQ